MNVQKPTPAMSAPVRPATPACCTACRAALATASHNRAGITSAASGVGASTGKSVRAMLPIGSAVAASSTSALTNDVPTSIASTFILRTVYGQRFHAWDSHGRLTFGERARRHNWDRITGKVRADYAG